MGSRDSGAVGCVLIEDYLSGTTRLSGLSSFLRARGVRVYEPGLAGAGDLLSAMQAALLAARSGGAATVVACGAGCGGALALAEQLPVEKLALIDPRPPLCPAGTACDAGLRRQAARLARFAARNLPLCVADTLLIRGQTLDGGRRYALRGLGGRLVTAELCGADANKVYTECENTLKNGIYSFLLGGDFGKSLAENPEMCIIYG